MNRYLHRSLASLTAMTLMPFVESVATADERVLEEVNVTATRRADTDIQTTPVAVSAVNEEEFDRMFAQDIGEVALHVFLEARPLSIAAQRRPGRLHPLRRVRRRRSCRGPGREQPERAGPERSGAAGQEQPPVQEAVAGGWFQIHSSPIAPEGAPTQSGDCTANEPRPVSAV